MRPGVRWSVCTLRRGLGREALFWGMIVAVVGVVLSLAWRQPVNRSAEPASPFAEMSVVRYKGTAEAPDFSLPSLDGDPVTLSALRGQVVFLNFWATWCPPCREEMPSIERLHRELRIEGLAVLALDVGESPAVVARFVESFRLSFPVLLDADSEVSRRYGISGLPTTVLVDRSGRVVGGAVGPRDWASPAGRALMRSLLDSQATGAHDAYP